jgi:HD-like signal output (HDOD) protein
MAIKHANYIDTLKEADDNHALSITQIEDKYYNTSHDVIGYYIAASWGLPKELCKVIRQHHDTTALDQNVSTEFRAIYSCLKMACNIVEQLALFKDTRDWPLVKASVLDSLGLTDQDYQDLLEDIAELLS